jgi:diguanylate cyclase (GGDEF)-like protein
VDQTGLSRTIASTATLKLANIHALDPFFTPLEERFERITRLAQRALNLPVAAITLVEGERQWFKSVAGWGISELPLDKSLCREVLTTGTEIIVEDTLHDLYLMDNPYVRKKPKFRFYAGYPIKDSDGSTVGTFCVMDVKPRKVDEDFRAAHADLGEMAQRELFSLELNSAQAELVAKLDRARRQAMFDSLTRIWNRRGGMDLLGEALKECASFKQTVGICLADLDHFKKVNDRFGHRVGDHVLRKTASTIVACVRPNDVVCRHGGEEFLIIVRDVDEQACLAIGQRICDGIRQMKITSGGKAIHTTISVGVALRGADETLSPARLVELADRALYRSKDAGRDCVSINRGSRRRTPKKRAGAG